MAGLDNLSVEEFKRALTDAILEGSRLSASGVGPSVGAGGSGARTTSFGEKDLENFKSASSALNSMSANLSKANKGLDAYRRITEGQGLNTQIISEGFKDLDDAMEGMAKSAEEGTIQNLAELEAGKQNVRAQAIYRTNIALTGNAMIGFSKVISGTVVPGLFNVAKGLTDGSDAADAGANMMNLYVDTFEKSMKVVTKGMAEAGQAMSNLGGKAGKVGVAMTLLAPIIEMLVGGTAALAREMIDMSKVAYKRQVDMFNNLTQSGAMFAGGVEAMRNAALGSGLTMEQYSRIVQKSSKDFADSGLGVTEAVKLMGGAMKAGGTDMKRDMLALGYSFEEQGELMAETMANMRRGGEIGPGDEAAIAQATSDYAGNLKLISALTGDDARKRMASAKEANNELAFRAKLAQLGPEQATMIEQATAKMSAIEAKAFREKVVYGQIISKDAAVFASTSKGFTERINNFATSFNQGTLNVEKVADIQAQTADQIRKEIIARGPDIGAAAMAGASGLTKDVAGAMVGILDDTYKQTKGALDNARKNIEGQKDEAKDPTSETNVQISNMIKYNEALVKQQEIMAPLAKSFGNVTNALIDDLKGLQDKIKDFQTMTPEDVKSSLELNKTMMTVVATMTTLIGVMTLMPGSFKGAINTFGKLLGGGKGGLIGKLGGMLSKGAGGASKMIGGAARAAGPASGALLKGGLKAAAGAAKFIPGVGLAVTAAMGIFDGMTAGIEEYKKSGKIGSAVKEGFAGALSGLTFGLVDQKTISEGFDTIGDFASNSFKALKEKVDISAIKNKVSGIAKSVTGAVGNFFGGLFGGSEKEAKKQDSPSEAKTDPKQAKIEQLKSRIESLKEQVASGPQRTMRARKNKRDLAFYENQLKQLQPTSTTSGVPVSKTVSTQTGKPLEDAKQAEMTKQQEEAKKKADMELAAKNEEAKKKEQERLAGMNPQERTNELLTRVVTLLDDSAGSQRTLARNSL